MLTDRSQLAPPAREALARELAPLHLLEDVARWAFAQEPLAAIADVVIQDEYTHDVIVPWREGRWLVFGTT